MVNPRLLNDDNMSSDAIKRRKIEASKSTTKIQITSQSLHKSSPTTQSKPTTARQASVEAIHDDNNNTCHNAGSPKNPSTILESVDDDEDIYVTQPAIDAHQVEGLESETEESAETNEEELGKSPFVNTTHCRNIFIPLPLAHLQKDWRSKVYAFFQSKVGIVYVDDRKCHKFVCDAKHCKGKGKNARIVRRYLDTKDKASTKSLRAHAIKCWGLEIVEKSEDAKDIASGKRRSQGCQAPGWIYYSGI
jgi:hypothetical protein